MLTVECGDYVGDEDVGEVELRLGQTARLTVEHRHHHRQTAILLLVNLCHAATSRNIAPLPSSPPLAQSTRLALAPTVVLDRMLSHVKT